MSAETPKHRLDEVSSDQYDTAFPARMRRAYMEQTSLDEVHFYRRVFEAANIKPGSTILDIGCGDGQDLITLASDFGQYGKLIGLEIPPPSGDEGDFSNRFLPAIMQMEELGLSNIEFVQGVAQDIPLKDNQVDVVLALAVLQHAPDISKAMAEIQRVLKPSGTLVVVTNSETNKRQHHRILQEMGGLLRSDAPSPLSSKFSYEIACQTIPNFFTVMRTEVQQNSELIINRDNLQVMLASLDTYRDSFKPPVEDIKSWLEARRIIAEDPIMEVINQNGAFYDNLERGAIIAKNSLTLEKVYKYIGESVVNNA